MREYSFCEIRNRDISAEFLFALNLEEKSIVPIPRNKATETIVPLPFDSELVSFGEAIEEYSMARDIICPRKKTMNFLREKGLDCDFRDFQDNLVKDRLKKWISSMLNEEIALV